MESRSTRSLTWKLVLGFLFAGVLQVLQMATSSYFTSRTQESSLQVSAALTASLAVERGLEAVVELRRRLAEELAAARPATDAAVFEVYLQEIVEQVAILQEAGALEGRELQAVLTAKVAHAVAECRTLRELQAAHSTPEAVHDAVDFVDDAANDVLSALQRRRVEVRELAESGVRREAELHDLPVRASLVITLIGVVLMSCFVVWFSRQLVVPIRRVWAGLEDLVQERTREIEAARQDLLHVNRELMVAWNAAESASRAKTSFLANVSHELRTPMTAILGFAEEVIEGVAKGVGPEVVREAGETIRRNAAQLIGIVNDLLDTAKLEAGKLAVERVTCSPFAVVDEVVALLRPAAQAKGLSLEHGCRGAVPAQVLSDPKRLRQIVTNIVHNAVKFTAAGSVRVELGASANAPDLLEITVTDTGIGMTPDVLARLFRPFEQADGSTTRQFGGTGLGLTISRQLAVLLGGDIEVVSRPGEGTTFRITVDAGVASDVPRLSTWPSQPATTATPTVAEDLHGMRVLVAEDGPDNQRLLGHILKRAGCSWEIVSDGRQCVDRIAAAGAAFDVVLMDVQMPVMDGLTAASLLRQEGSVVPIVALTANAMVSDREACLAAGCDHFLTKPIDRRELLRVLAAIRSSRPSAVTSPEV